MMLNPWLILGFVLALAGSFVAGDIKGHRAENIKWESRVQKERADAEVAAREKETMWQGVVNGTVRNYETKVAAVVADLDRIAAGLRDRPERPAGVPENPRPACAGASGAELSRTDAEFLVGEAARADRCRAGLEACYQVIDGVR